MGMDEESGAVSQERLPVAVCGAAEYEGSEEGARKGRESNGEVEGPAWLSCGQGAEK
jgi:hypothetical protein